jgi:hypothetical protein
MDELTQKLETIRDRVPSLTEHAAKCYLHACLNILLSNRQQEENEIRKELQTADDTILISALRALRVNEI